MSAAAQALSLVMPLWLLSQRLDISVAKVMAALAGRHDLINGTLHQSKSSYDRQSRTFPVRALIMTG
jgi:hypothetical protein